jgi:hypothetical protein
MYKTSCGKIIKIIRCPAGGNMHGLWEARQLVAKDDCFLRLCLEKTKKDCVRQIEDGLVNLIDL